MSITPTPFGTPGGAEDNPDYVDAESVASGPAGIAEEIVKLGRMVAGTDFLRILES